MNWIDPLGLTKSDPWYGYNDRDFQWWFHNLMADAQFLYLDGQEMKVGDKVLVDGESIAYVDDIFTPGTELAEAFGCANSPGFVLRYEDGNYIVWSRSDFDLVLLERAKS